MASESALGNTVQVTGTTRIHWSVTNNSTKKIMPLMSHSMSKVKCHQRAIPME